MTVPQNTDDPREVNEQRRTALLGMARVMAYVPPLVATFAMGGMSIREAHAYGSNSLPSCWVARAAFGEADLRWMIFREWLLGDAPAWFRRLYLRHGEALGSWLNDHPAFKAPVRALMMLAINRTLRKAMEYPATA